MIPSLLGQPGFDDGWIQALEPLLGIEALEDGLRVAFDRPGDGDLVGFAQKVLQGVKPSYLISRQTLA